MEDADVVFLWGSNARHAHPIWFHHLLKGVHRGTRLYVMDPRRTASAAWADVWMGLHSGSDVALSNTLAREIIHAGLAHRTFIEHATTGFEAYAAAVEPYTLAEGERLTGVPAAVIREAAHTFATADKAMIAWTLGITEHHNSVDNVLALINLALLTGHVGRWACGCNPLRGQNNVQGGGDMGALPNRLPGFQDILNDDTRARFERHYGVPIQPKHGRNLTEMLEAMADGEMSALLCAGENPVQSDADGHRVADALGRLDHLVVQEIFLTATAKLAHVVLPATASWCEADGTVTNSERRVQRIRKAKEPPAGARDELWIFNELASRLGVDLGTPNAEQVWNEFRVVAPHLAGGMSYERLATHGGLQWPCPDESHPGEAFLHGRLWETPLRGPRVPFSVVQPSMPYEVPDADFPFLLTTGRRLESYNTGVQTGAYQSPLHTEETIDLSPEDAARLEVRDGDVMRVSSRRGAVLVPARVDHGLRAGLVFMTFHSPDVVNTNLLTHDAHDHRSGTAAFKSAAVRVERVNGSRKESL